MTALPFAWRSLVRQPARSTLGVLGVAAVGALLFDMLLLSDVNAMGVVVLIELRKRTAADADLTGGPQRGGADRALRTAAPRPARNLPR